MTPMDVDVNWAGMVFRTAGGSVGSTGIRTIRQLRGWREAAPSAARTFEHWSVAGQVVGDDRLGPRTIEMQGLLMANTTARVQEMQGDMARVTAHTFTVTENDLGLSRLTTVRPVDSRFEVLSPLTIDYSITFVADDPLRYTAASRTLTNGSNNISNAGNEPASPTLTLVGPHSALTIVHPDGTYQFAALASGQTRVLDFRNGDVWDASTRVFGVESGPRPVVRSGGSSWTVSGLGSGSATLTRFAAWS